MFPLYPNLADNKRKRSEEEESEDLVENEEVVTKKLKPKLQVQAKPDVDLTKEALCFRNDSPGEPGEEGLYDPHEDLWVQWHTDGIENPKKRRLFIRELRNEDFQWRRNEAHQKLRELEEDFLNGLENAIAGFSDPFQHLRKEYEDTRWNRIKNVSVEGDERIQRIEALCQAIPKVFEDQGYVVLRKAEEGTKPKKDTYERVASRQSSGEN